MGLFGRGKGGGMMNVIRCDEDNYLVWKWTPEGQDVNSTSRENSIRYGSSLRVKDGEVAVFVYKQKDGTIQDFIEGPFDQTIKTANFPVLSSIVGMAYGGESPFQAEVYFINLAGNNQVRFAVPYFDVFDPRLPDHGIPMAVRGTITFNITDYKGFIKLNRLISFNHEKFQDQIKEALKKYIKGVVMNIPREMGIPVVQMESQILTINERIQTFLKPRIEGDFGVNLKALDIGALDIDKDSRYYKEVRILTAENTAKTMQAQVDLNIENLQQTQALNLKNMEETLRIQREEAQRAQRLQTEQTYIGAHTIDVQADVLKEGAKHLGEMGGTMDLGSGSYGGINPAGMMTGMMMGGAIGKQMAGMMNNMGQAINNSMQQSAPGMTPPPIPEISFFLSVNGQQQGPFNMPILQQMAQTGQLTPQTYVWKQGMTNWAFAKDVPELAGLFAPPAPGSMPPPPPMP